VIDTPDGTSLMTRPLDVAPEPRIVLPTGMLENMTERGASTRMLSSSTPAKLAASAIVK
jgi:hypothetical protein